MKFNKYGNLNPNLTTEIKPLEFVDRAVFKRLDYLLGYLQPRDLQEDFVERLSIKVRNSLKEPGLGIEKYDFSNLEKFSNLANHPDLVELQLKFFGQLLQIPVFPNLEESPIEISDRNYLRSYLVPRYIQTQVLAEIMGKETATRLVKSFVDDYTISVRDLVTQVDDLEAVRKHNLGDNPEDMEGWVIVVSEVADGKWLMRNDNCPMVEALDDFKDQDLTYLACCHGDFIYAEMMNDNIKFTRNYTIAEGHPYCDKVFHDTRFSNLEHPDKAFWDSLDTNLESIPNLKEKNEPKN